MTPLRLLIFLIIALLLVSAAVTLYVNDVISENVPSLEQLENPKQNLATQLFSSDGRLVDQYFEHQRISLIMENIPQDFINALIATEDKEFYDHWGVHVGRIFRAAITNIGRVRPHGASTITQQLARNLYLDQSPTLERKIREAYTAIQIEKNYSKKEIIEMYCNTVHFGRSAYGLQVAATVYFGKEPKELTLAECALLVAMLKAPNYYDPAKNYDIALSRRNLVLELMLEHDVISSDEYTEALLEPITLKQKRSKNEPKYLAPHFVEHIRQELGDDNRLYSYDLYRDGLVIYTTLNSEIQKYANQAVAEHIGKYQDLFDKNWSWSNNKSLLNKIIKEAIARRPDFRAADASRRNEIEKKLRNDKHFVDSVKNAVTTIQAGVVVLDPQTGAVLALVGASKKFMDENADAKYSLNHVTQIQRQPGSSFKPFVYAKALETGMSPYDMVECGPFIYKDSITGEVWTPRIGADCKEGEKVTLYDGLRRSINSVAARLITEYTDPFEVKKLLMRAGIESKLHAVPALSLGAGGEIKPIELASAFCIFNARGYHFNPHFVTRVEDRFGNLLFEHNKAGRVNDALSREVAETMTYMMQAVVNNGTAARIRSFFRNVEAAGKTGTTNDNADAWFVGYTPELVAGVWVGFDDQRINFDCIGKNGQGGRAAGPIWGLLMNKIYSDNSLAYRQKKFSLKLFEETFFPDSLNMGMMPIRPDSLKRNSVQ